VSAELDSRSRRAPYWLAALSCALLVPFADKAFHIDDPLFVWTAQHILEHPLDFYGFDVNWYGWKEPISDIAQNPPLVSYYAALVGSLFGFGERAMHIAFLVPAALLIVGTWRLARRFTELPVLAALIALATPAFLVSSTTVMCDVSMVCLWVWAVVWWTEGIDENRRVKLAGASLAIAAASFTKYFGMCSIPLLAVYAFARGARWRAMWLVLPVGVLALYQAWTIHLYGHGLLLQAAQYANEQHGRDANPRHVALILGLVFSGGCLLPLACFAHRVWSLRTLAVLVVIGIVGALLVVWAPSTGSSVLPASGGMRFAILAQLSAWCAVGAGVMLLAVEDLRSKRDARSLLLALWVIGTFVFACFVNWTTNARSLLPMVPAVAILIARRLERGADSARSELTPRSLAPLIPALAAGLCLVWADARLAAAGKIAAQAIAARPPPTSGRAYFEGHWGFQHYMQALGYEALDFKTFRLEPGDWIAIPHNTVGAHPLPAKTQEVVETLRFPVSSWISTTSPELSASFYASKLGLLPFAFGPVPDEAYDITRMVLPVAPRR
jgi:4-amino-4-deoxy-L-arabinose transferase-like glycosyltransferase